MGGTGSSTRKVSFGLDEEEKVTVIQGVKLSEDVLQRMRETEPQKVDSHKPPPGPKLTEPAAKKVQEELSKTHKLEQALKREELDRLAQNERDRKAAAETVQLQITPSGQNPEAMTSDLLIEKCKTHEELQRANLLAKQLERKDRELTAISAFYKEQLEILEKKNLDDYKQTAEHYNQAATSAEAHILPRRTSSVCTELQSQVLQCYRDNPQHTLLCSGLARKYIACIQQAKMSEFVSRG